MNKKAYVYISLAIVALVVIAVFMTVRHSGQGQARILQPTKLADVQSASANRPACTAKQTNSDLKYSSTDRDDITNAVVGMIIDVPAGTNVDVNVQSYDGTMAKGSSIYTGKYGSYNFTATKFSQDENSYHSPDDTSFQRGWKITAFEACK